MSYYENRIKELEHRIEQIARANRIKAIPVEAQLIDRIAELNKENARLKAEVERLRKAGDDLCSTMEANGIHDNGDFEMHEKAIAQWNAAKEGKPSV